MNLLYSALLYLSLFTIILVYIIYKAKSFKKNNKSFIPKEVNYQDVEIALLGDIDLDNINYTESKFENPKETVTLPLDLIIEGQILSNNLNMINKDQDWLIDTLNNKGVSHINKVTQATLEPSGKIVIS